MPVLWTRIRTSLMPIGGSGTSISSRPGPGAVLTRARISRPPSAAEAHDDGLAGQSDWESARTLPDPYLVPSSGASQDRGHGPSRHAAGDLLQGPMVGALTGVIPKFRQIVLWGDNLLQIR